MRLETQANMSRLFGRLLIFAALLMSVPAAPALAWTVSASPQVTLVQDTLYRANGVPAQGTVTVRWQGFTTVDGLAVASGEITTTLDAAGNLSLPLAPNAGASPAGGYYRATIKLSDGTTSEETWVVPQAATATLAQIRAKVVPQSVAAQFVTQSTLQAAVAAALATPGPIGGKSPSSINATVVWTEVVNGEYNAGGFNTLQAAVNTAAAAGVYKVKIPEGTYTGSATLTMPSGMTLECVSRKAVITIANSASVDVVTIPRGNSNVTVRNCTIDGNMANQTDTGVNAPYGANYAYGLHALGQNSNITVDNVMFTNTLGMAFMLESAGNPGVVFNKNIAVRNSSFVNTGSGGLQFMDVQGGYFTGNYFNAWGVKRSFVDAIGANGQSTDIHVTGNTGIAREGTQAWFMEVGGNPRMVEIDHGDISGNLVEGSSTMAGAGFSGDFTNTSFTNNYLSLPATSAGCYYGASIELGGSRNNVIHGNHIVNGAITLSSVGGGTDTGVVEVSNNNEISGNVFTGTCATPSLANGVGFIAFGGNLNETVTTTKIFDNIFDTTALTAAYLYNPIAIAAYGGNGDVAGYEVYGNTFLANSYATNGAAVYLWNVTSSQAISSGSVHDNVFSLGGNVPAVATNTTTAGVVNGLTIYDNDFTGSNGVSVTGSNVTQWGNKSSATDTQQHLNGGANVDTTGALGVPGGIGGGLLSGPSTTNLGGFYRASDVCTTNGASLSSWADTNGTGPALTAGTTAGTCETGVVNGNATVRFVGGTTNGYAGSASWSSTTGQTVIVVYRKTVGTTGQLMDGDWMTYGNYGGLSFTTATTLTLNGAHGAFSSTIPDDGAFHVAAYTLDNSGNYVLYFDGAVLATNPTVGGANLFGLTIGARHDSGTGGFTGDIAETLVYPTPLTQAQLQGYGAYAANRYGLTLTGSWYINSTGASLPKVTAAMHCIGTSCITAWPTAGTADGNTVSGSAAPPASTTGANGDYYVVSATGCIWGPKASGAWPAGAAFCPGTGSSSGSVTSVGLSLPSIFSVSGSPVTTSGTLTAMLASQTANTVLAAPNGSAGAPSFRALAAADIPSLSALGAAAANASTTVNGVNCALGGSCTLPELSRYAVRTCGVGLGDGTNAITAGTYTLGGQCRNMFGSTYNITGISCYTDAGSTSINVADSALNALLTGAITGANTWASGTQSTTTTLASGVWTTWTIVADGSTRIVSCTLTGTI